MVGWAEAHPCHKHNYLTAQSLQDCKEQEKQEGEGERSEGKKGFSYGPEPGINATTRKTAYRNGVISAALPSLLKANSRAPTSQQEGRRALLPSIS